MIAYLLEALGGTVLVALAAYCTWHEERLIALEERIAKAVKERMALHAIQIPPQMPDAKRPLHNRRSGE